MELELTVSAPLVENMKNQLGFIYNPETEFADKLPEDWQKDIKLSLHPSTKYKMDDHNLNVAIWSIHLGKPNYKALERMYGLPVPCTKDGERTPYELVFHSAVALLFAVRLEASGLDGVIGKLTRAGIFYNTAREFNHNHLSIPQVTPESLPMYRSDYAFTQDDVTQYRAGVEQFIRGPRGRAAFTTGGLISRIAQDVLPWSECINVIKCGPSSNVITRRKNCLYKKLNGQHLYDDLLTLEEKQLVLGVFNVYDIKTKVVSRKSWWPGPTELDSGQTNEYCWYWSEQNEMKYLNRKAELDGPKPVPLKVKEWTGKLRGSTKRLRVVETMEKEAEIYMNTFFRSQRL